MIRSYKMQRGVPQMSYSSLRYEYFRSEPAFQHALNLQQKWTGAKRQAIARTEFMAWKDQFNCKTGV